MTPTTLDELDTALADIHRNRRWIVATDAAAASTTMVEKLREWSAEVVAVVSATNGLGGLPENVPIVLTGSQGTTVMTGIREYRNSIVDPSWRVQAVVDSLDPERTAVVIGFDIEPGPNLVGRRMYAPRPESWAELEDKTVIDAVWDAAGVDRAPSAVVPVADAVAAAIPLSGPLGTVWAADNKEGWHGGGEYTRWVRTAAEAEAAVKWFAPRADTVRVMPFLEGIPCSIHGFVSGGEVASFRPVEMLILREAGASRLRYAGPATFWDPPAHRREEMREAARRTARHLSAEVGYRGAFSIDGVLTADGFRPTELNPRLSAGLITQARSGGFPLGSVARAVVAGDLDVPAGWIESMIVPMADAHRVGRQHIHLDADVEAQSHHFGWDGHRVTAATEDTSALDAEIGQGPAGTLLRITCKAAALPTGPPVAPAVAAVLAELEERVGLGVPRYTAAPDVSREEV